MSTDRGRDLCRDCAAESAPTGIKLVCAVGGLFGLFSLILGLRLLGLAPLLGLVTTGLSLGQLAVLYGLWTLRTWAWGAALILFGLGVLVNLLQALTGAPSQVVSVAVGLLIVGYVYTQHEYYLPDETGPT